MSPLSHQLPIWCAVGDEVVDTTNLYFYSVGLEHISAKILTTYLSLTIYLTQV